MIALLALITALVWMRGPLDSSRKKPVNSASEQLTKAYPQTQKLHPLLSTDGLSAPSDSAVQLVESGRLVLEARNQRLGEETYRLERLPTGDYRLISKGHFSVRVMVADVKVEYTQEIRSNADWKPLFFSGEIWGPLGLGDHSMQIQFESGRAQVLTDGREQEIDALPGRFAVLGLFSSYTLATKLLTGEERTHLRVFVASGFSHSTAEPARDSKSPLVSLEIIRLAPLKIRDRATASEREVDQYSLKLEGAQGDSSEGLRLLTLDGEFLGLVVTPHDSSKGPFKIYRADLFPEGFEVLFP